MKVVYELTGSFERFTTDNQTVEKTSLSTLVKNLRAIATTQGHHHIKSIHQSFGLNFLPESTVKHIFEQVDTESPFLTSSLLSSANTELNHSPIFYNYRFCSSDISLDLSPDDPQIPSWSGDRVEGTYNLMIDDNNTHPQLQDLLQQAKIAFQQKKDSDIIRFALHSPENFAIPLVLSTGESLKIWLEVKELPQYIQEAILVLSRSYKDISVCPQAQELIDEYNQIYGSFQPKHLQGINIPIIDPSSDPEFVIGPRKHRQILEAIISSAQEFLAIASFRLEDRDSIKLFAKKSLELPQGVWILTDLTNNVLDRVDKNMEGKKSKQDEYAHSDSQKKRCLQLLADSGVSIRSGLFHFKCCITEKSAYLGSCNLTGGSLERNFEGGIIWKNSQEHHQLYQSFCNFWEQQTTAEIFASPQSIYSYGLPNPFHLLPNDSFLNQKAYLQDLTKNLQELALNSSNKDSSNKVIILTRNFQPTSQQTEILTKLKLNFKLFYGNYNNSSLPGKRIEHLHAKIVVLGKKVAYIGSQDFAATRPIHELTYKTTKPQEINNIYKEINVLVSKGVSKND